MKKFFKILLWVVIIIILLLIIAGFVLAKVIDVNKFKPEIEKAVYQSTGRHMVIQGKLHLSIFPSVGIKTGQITIDNPAGYQQKVFAQIQSANISVQLLPLLSHSIDINTISVQGLRLNLIQTSPTQNNWTFGKAQPTKPVKPASKTHKKAASTKSSNLNFVIRKLNVHDAQVQYQDLQKHTQYLLRNVVFEGENVGLNQSFPMHLAFTASSNVPPVQAKVDVRAHLTLQQHSQQYALNKMTLTAQVVEQRKDQKPLTVNATLSGNAVINMADKTLHISPAVTINNLVKIKSTLAVGSLLDQNQFKGNLSVAPFDINQLLESLGNKPIKLPNPNALSNTSFSTTISGDKDHLDLSHIVGTLNHSKLTGGLAIANFKAPKVKSQLHINQIEGADFANLNGALLPIQGLTLNTNVHMSGLSKAQFPSTLNGEVDFHIRQATLKGVDLGAVVKAVGETVQGMFDPKQRGRGWSNLQAQFPQNHQPINPNNGKQTDIGAFILKAPIKNGVITFEKAQLVSPSMHADMQGSLDMNTHNYLNALFLVYGVKHEMVNGQTQTIPGAFKLPYFVKGPLSQLQYGIDWPEFQKQINALLAKAVQKGIHNAIRKEAGKLLQGLFHH